MTTGFLLLGLGMAGVGILVPFLFYWTNLKRIRVVLVSEGFQNGEGYTSLPPDLWGYLAILLISVPIACYVFLSETTKPSSEIGMGQAQLTATQREIPETAKASIIRELRDAGSFETEILYFEESEAMQYARDFYTVLVQAGWQVSNPSPGGWETIRPGVQIVVPDTSAPPQGAKILFAVLQKHDIDVEFYEVSRRKSGTFVIMVRSRP